MLAHERRGRSLVVDALLVASGGVLVGAILVSSWPPGAQQNSATGSLTDVSASEALSRPSAGQATDRGLHQAGSPGRPTGPIHTKEGVLAAQHGDNFAAGATTGTEYVLTTDDSETKVTFEQPPSAKALGRRVKVEGVADGPRLFIPANGRLVAAGGSGTGGGGAGNQAGATGSRRVAVVLLNFANDPSQPYTSAHAAGVAFTNTDSVAAYYSEVSWGQLNLTGDVLGWYTVQADNTTCATSTWASQAAGAASADGIDVAAYDHVVFAFPYTPSCGWAGLATMPGRHSWLNGPGAMGLHVMAHELGHNFGTHHASALSCTVGGVRVALASPEACSLAEYGDPFSVMGSGGRYHHTAFGRGNLGWLDRASTLDVTTSGEYFLAPVENGGSAARVLRIERSSGTYFLLEYRQSGGVFDAFSGTDPVVNGVSIRIAAEYSQQARSQLVDTTPLTTTFADAPLVLGQTVLDPTSGIGITTLAAGSTGVTVRVTFGPPPDLGPTPTPTPTSTPAPDPTEPPPTDLEPPTAPANVTVVPGKGRKVTVSWVASLDNVAVAGYRLYRNGMLAATTTTTSIGDSPPPRSSATYTVVAFDSSGNESSPSVAVLYAP